MPSTMPLEKPGDVTGFFNLNRRHLMPGQMAVIVAAAQDWEKAQVKGANRHTIKMADADHLATVDQRRALSGAGDRTQRNADKLARADLHPNLDTFAACKWGNI